MGAGNGASVATDYQDNLPLWVILDSFKRKTFMIYVIQNNKDIISQIKNPINQ